MNYIEMTNDELNKLAHETMGLCWCDCELEKMRFPNDSSFPCVKCGKEYEWDFYCGFYEVRQPKYCTNLNAAWKLPEYFIESHSDRKIGFKLVRCSDGKHYYGQFFEAIETEPRIVIVNLPNPNDLEAFVKSVHYSDIPARAVVMAFLEAVENG